LGDDRACPSNGDAEVVEELGVDPIDGSLPVGGDGVGEIGEHGAESVDRRHLRVERNGRRSREPGEVDAGRRCRDGEHIAFHT
jgi:hypothetical protein